MSVRWKISASQLRNTAIELASYGQSRAYGAQQIKSLHGGRPTLGSVKVSGLSKAATAASHLLKLTSTGLERLGL